MHSIFDGTYLNSTQKTAIQNGTQTGDLTTNIHSALNDLDAGTFPNGTANGSGPGAALYFPAGLYPCNIILGVVDPGNPSIALRNNVHLVGESYGGTRFTSFAAGGFAVIDATNFQPEFAPLWVVRRSIRNIGFDGGDWTRSGLLIASLSGTETADLQFYKCQIGLMVCDTYYGTHFRPWFRNCDIAAWFGTISGTITGLKLGDDNLSPAANIVLPSFLTAHVGHAGNQQLIGGNFTANRIGLLALAGLGEGTPNLQIRSSSFEGNYISVFVPDNTALIAGQARTPANGTYLENIWFEANGAWRLLGAGTETVNGWTGDRGDLHLGSGYLYLTGAGIEQVTVADGAMLYGDLINYNSSGGSWLRMTASLGHIVYDRATGPTPDFSGPIVKRPVPEQTGVGKTTTAFIPPKHSYGRNPNALIADTCAGTALPVGVTLSASFLTFGVDDGPITTPCWQMDAPAGVFSFFGVEDDRFTAGKAYLLMLAVKLMTGTGISLFAGNGDVMHHSKYIPPESRWRFIAFASVAATPMATKSFILGIVNTAPGSSLVQLRIGGISVLEFDTKEEAAEICASEVFPIKALPPRSRVLA